MTKPILIYDTNTVPYGLTMQQVTEIYENHKIVVYDGMTSRTQGRDGRPVLIGGDVTIKGIDVNTLSKDEFKTLINNVNLINNVIAEEEFPAFCNYDGRITSKYAYFVRVIKNVAKTTPLNNSWEEEYQKVKESIIFPSLTMEQVEELRKEKLNQTIAK